MPRGITKKLWSKMNQHERNEWLAGHQRAARSARSENVVSIASSPRKPPARAGVPLRDGKEESPFVIAVLEAAKHDIDEALTRFSNRRAA
jgi:hypothetical protein